MSTIMLIALVVVFAVIFAARRGRRRPRVTRIDRIVGRKKESDDA